MPRDAAQALAPLAGQYAKFLFAFGLLNASLMAAVIVPLSTAYAVTEVAGLGVGPGTPHPRAAALLRHLRRSDPGRAAC